MALAAGGDLEEGHDEMQPLLPKGQYKVDVDLEDKTDLGLEFDHRSLTVKRVAPDGKIAEFNSNHPASMVQPGDRIVSANGESKLACRIVKAMRASKKLRLVFNRPGGTVTKKHRSLHQRLFNSDLNPHYAKQCECALRAGVFVLLASLPFLIPPGLSPFLDWAKKEKYFGSLSVIFFFFTFYRSVGETVYNATKGTMGTLLAGFNIFVMFGFFPNGVTKDSSEAVWWFAVVDLALYIWLQLWLQWDMNTTIFSIATFVYYWMAFVSPDETDSAGFSMGFQLKFGGTAVADLRASVGGCLIAIIATLLPYPMWALQDAEDTADHLVLTLGDVWERMNDYYTAAQPNIFERDKITVELLEIDVNSGRLAALIENSWWECFGMGKWQGTRMMTTELDRTIKEAFASVNLAWTACARNSTFSARHTELVNTLKQHHYDLVEESSLLMALCAHGTHDGFIVDHEADEIRKQQGVVKKMADNLHEALNADKAAYDGGKLVEELLEEHVYYTCVSSYGRLACELAARLVDNEKPTIRQLMAGRYDNIRSDAKAFLNPATLMDPLHLMWVLRNWMSMCIALTVGFLGYYDFISRYNAAIASKMAVLLSKTSGAALAGNLMKIQGTVLGVIMGQLVAAILGWCKPWAEVGTMIVMFAWTAGTMFIYFNSDQYAAVGFLLAVFGAKGMMNDCRKENENIEFQSADIINVVLALCMMTFVDTILAPGRGSDLAVDSYKKAWKSLHVVIEKLFDTDVKNTMAGINDKLLGQITLADTLGKEAANEARYWRCEWRTEQYRFAIVTAHKLRNCIAAMEHLVALEYEIGAPKNEDFQNICTLQSFQKVWGLLILKLEVIEVASELFSHELPGAPSALSDERLTRDIRTEALQAIGAFIREAADLKVMISHRRQSRAAHHDDDTQALLDSIELDADEPNAAEGAEDAVAFQESSGEEIDSSKGGDSVKNVRKDQTWLESEFSCQVSVVVVSIKVMFDQLDALHHELMQNLK